MKYNKVIHVLYISFKSNIARTFADSLIGLASGLAVYCQKNNCGDVVKVFFCGTLIITSYNDCAVKSKYDTG